MLAIKLQRIGRKHQPSYRVVVAEKRSKLGGPPVEDLGSYDPITKKQTVNKERVKHWIGVGAKPTPTVHNLFLKNQIIEGSKIKIAVRPSKKQIAAALAAAEEAKKVATSEAKEEVPVAEVDALVDKSAGESVAPTPAEGGGGVPISDGVGEEEKPIPEAPKE